MENTCYNPANLAEFGTISDWQPEMGRQFFENYGEVFQKGALTGRENNLIAVAHAGQYLYSIDASPTN